MIRFDEHIYSIDDVRTEDDALNFVYNNRIALSKIESLISRLYTAQDVINIESPYETVASYLRYRESLVGQMAQ